MLITTINILPNKECQVLGIVKGSAFIQNNIFQTVKNIISQDSQEELFKKAEKEAMQKLILAAEQQNADAVLGVIYSNNISSRVISVTITGTAIKYL